MNRSIVKTRVFGGYIESQLVVPSDEEFKCLSSLGSESMKSVINVDDYLFYWDCS